MSRIDLTLCAISPSITEHNCSSELIFELHAIDIVLPLNIIEISDVNDIISLKFRFDIDSLRIGFPSHQIVVSYKIFLLTFLIASCSEIVVIAVDISDINIASPNTRIRKFGCSVDYGRNPTLIICKKLRSFRTIKLILREQPCNVSILGSILRESAAGKPVMNKFEIVILHENVKGFTERPVALLCVKNDPIKIGMGENITLLLILIKYVVLHIFFLLFFIAALLVTNSSTNKGINNLFLFLIHSLKDFFDGFSIIIFFCFRFLRLFVFIFCHGVLLFVSMIELKILTHVYDGLVYIFDSVVRVSHTLWFNKCPGIRSSQNKTYFTNLTMNNIRPVLL